MIDTITSKGRLLEEAGYRYNFERMVYFNRRAKKVFSVEFVEDHSEAEIRRRIEEKPDGKKWRFYFNTPPDVPPSVKRQLEHVLG